MKWQGRRRSSNVEDRRYTRVSRSGGRVGGGALAGVAFTLIRRTSGKTRIVVILAAIIACFVFKISPLQMMGLSSGRSSSQVVQTKGKAPNDEMRAYLETMKAAEAIGDDRLQEQAHGHVQPDLFTHGTSAQRKHWFMKGYKTGDINQRDTFSISYDQL